MDDLLHSATKSTFLHEDALAHLAAVSLIDLHLLLKVLLREFGRRVLVDIGAPSNLRTRSMIESVTITLVVSFVKAG